MNVLKADFLLFLLFKYLLTNAYRHFDAFKFFKETRQIAVHKRLKTLTMKIELNKSQYKTLLTMMYCGEWVLNSHKTKNDQLSMATDDLEQVIFQFAKEAGLERWIEYDDAMKKYFPTADMEDEVHVYIDKYNKKL